MRTKSLRKNTKGSLIIEYAITTVVITLAIVFALGLVGVNLLRQYRSAQFILSLPVP